MVSFHEVIGDTLDPSRVRKVVFCSGKVYYDLAAAREAKKIDDVAVVRVEELYPFPNKHVSDVLARYNPMWKSSGARKSRATWGRGAGFMGDFWILAGS